MSVSLFTKDNNVYFEFYHHQCFVKTQDIKEIIFQGKINVGLYVFPTIQLSLKPSISNMTYNPVLTTFRLWHSRLGHVSSKIVHHVMKTV